MLQHSFNLTLFVKFMTENWLSTLVVTGDQKVSVHLIITIRKLQNQSDCLAARARGTLDSLPSVTPNSALSC
jgi:hypothetical protein